MQNDIAQYIRQLKDYARQNLSKGHAEAEIRAALQGVGWPHEWIEQAFEDLADNKPQIKARQAHKKYRVFQAVADTLRASKMNVRPLLFAMLTGLLLNMMFVVLLTFMLALAGAALLSLWSPAMISLGALIVLGLVVIMIISIYEALVYTPYVILVATILRDGSEGRRSKLSELRATLQREFWHVGGASILMSLRLLTPFFVYITALIICNMLGLNSVLLVSVGALAVVVTIFIFSLRYLLAPHVALFDKRIPLKHTLKRGYQLTRGRGQWFLCKVMLLLLPLAFVADRLSEQENTLLTLLLVALVMLCNYLFIGLLTMLYLNRKAVIDRAGSHSL